MKKDGRRGKRMEDGGRRRMEDGRRGKEDGVKCSRHSTWRRELWPEVTCMGDGLVKPSHTDIMEEGKPRELRGKVELRSRR